MRKPAWAEDARTGPVCRYKSLRVFAMEGMVCIITESSGPRNGDCKFASPSDFLKRIAEIARPYRDFTRQDYPESMRKELDWELRRLQELEQVVKDAIAMGDPTDPKVQAFWARHRRKYPSHFRAGSDLAGYPPLPPDSGHVVQPSHVVGTLPPRKQPYQPPRRKVTRL